jgi:hypothetical protein
MISIAECKKHIRATTLTDSQIEEVRDLLYAFVERNMDLQGVPANVLINQPICKTAKQEEVHRRLSKRSKPSSIAVSLPTGKRKRVTGLMPRNSDADSTVNRKDMK